MSRRALLCVLLASCGFEGGGGSAGSVDSSGGGDAPPSTNDARADDGAVPDAPTEQPLDVAHIGATDEAAFTPTNDILAGSMLVDTSTPATQPLVAGTRIRVVSSNAGEVAFLEVRTLAVGTLMVTGSRPLVIHATGSITIGSLFAAARATLPGPGGSLPGMGSSPGLPGNANANADGGGGGGGYGSIGKPGGASTAATSGAEGGAGGALAGDAILSALAGGSGGGHGSPLSCNEIAGGAGGGAIQLSSETTITITGTIDVGGGGGRAGSTCGGNYSAAGGGGAGGAIYLQSREGVSGGGFLAANGGGGGGAAHFMNGLGQPGADGSTTSTAATGGPGATGSGDGGDGGATASVAQPGGDGHNGGGGGGGAGRIVIDVPAGVPIAITSSPQFQRVP